MDVGSISEQFRQDYELFCDVVAELERRLGAVIG